MTRYVPSYLAYRYADHDLITKRLLLEKHYDGEISDAELISALRAIQDSMVDEYDPKALREQGEADDGMK